MNRIRGKCALVTGASSGIGQSCARRLAADGVNLVLWARRKDRLEALAKDLTASHGVAARVQAVDVRDRAAVERAAAQLTGEQVTPDILINNAGLAAGFAKLHEGNPDDWDRMIDTNVKGLLYVTRAFLPGMVARDSGHVVNIGSLAGHQVYPMGNVYNASKFAVKALTDGTHMDLLGTNVRVSSVDAGHVGTEFAQVRFGGDADRAQQVYQGFTPLTPDEVADVVLYVLNQPESVNILDVVLTATAQRSVHHVHRKER